ncbi:MAG: cytochrome c [Acidobacteria bacterium]|nr:MAG: cytochrome c [Acidobacteriota bacterium]
MRTFYALSICLFLLVPGISQSQEKQPQQGNQQTQTAGPSTAASPAKTAPHEFVISPEQKARKNPEKFTEESTEKGKSLYMTQCAMCHGKTGDGKGDLAEVMHVSPPDFTVPDTLGKRTDGELFAIINAGSDSMPAEEKRLKEFQTWNLVNFLRTLEGKKPAKSVGMEAGTTKQ